MDKTGNVEYVENGLIIKLKNNITFFLIYIIIL